MPLAEAFRFNKILISTAAKSKLLLYNSEDVATMLIKLEAFRTVATRYQLTTVEASIV